MSVQPEERVLDWEPRFDERSRDFPIRATIGDKVSREKKFWRAHVTRLNQGREGACVGYAWAQELMARPNEVAGRGPNPTVDGVSARDFARRLYHRAQRLDRWEGEAYSGTSVLAGAKATQQSGYISGYRWAFGIDDVIDALVAHGPIVVGVNWYQNMYRTRPSGLVEVGGRKVGGHAILLTGYHPKIRLMREGYHKRFEVVKWRNSWGWGYGRRGDGYIKVEDLAALLDERGEACVPVGRVTQR
jgi:hypothetical protein